MESVRQTKEDFYVSYLDLLNDAQYRLQYYICCSQQLTQADETRDTFMVKATEELIEKVAEDITHRLSATYISDQNTELKGLIVDIALVENSGICLLVDCNAESNPQQIAIDKVVSLI